MIHNKKIRNIIENSKHGGDEQKQLTNITATVNGVTETYPTYFELIKARLVDPIEKSNKDTKFNMREVVEKVTVDRLVMNKAGYRKWLSEEIMKNWVCPASTDHKILTDLKRNDKMQMDPNYGYSVRSRSISALKYDYTYNTMDMIIFIMKIYDYTTNLESNYGMLFVEIVTDPKKYEYRIIPKSSMFGNIAFTYYCAAPSYISLDGEYRSNFSKYNALAQSKKLFAELWEELSSYAARVKTRRRWMLNRIPFYPKIDQASRNMEVESTVQSQNVMDDIFVLAWFHVIYKAFCNITEIHVNENFKSIFLGEYLHEDIKFLTTCAEKYGAGTLDLFRVISTINSSQKDTNDPYVKYKPYFQCGFKMIPLNVKEVQDPMKLKYKPWREYYVSNALNDLIVNSIAPGFAIMLDWFYIKNSRKGLFDNKAQYERMKSSELAVDILHTLYEAQRGTYFVSEDVPGVIKTEKEVKQWMVNNNKFKKLYAKIDEPINYSLEELIMSEVTLAFVSEFVGRTVADSIALTVSSPYYDNLLGNPLKDSGYNCFAKYLFDICYNMYCMNSKLGIIHGDFHLNNATIGQIYYAVNDEMKDSKRNRVVYNVDGVRYIFPNNLFFGCIIDFSRAILNPNFLEQLDDKSLPAANRIVSDMDKFRNTEIINLLTYYIGLYPNKAKQKEELLVLFKNHFNEVFKILTAIDIWMFSIRLNAQLGSLKNTTVSKKAIALVTKIVQLSEKYLSVEMNQLIHDNSYATTIAKSDYPLLSIIKKCWPEFVNGEILNDDIDKCLVTDYYCYNNKLQYSLSKHELFPPFIKNQKFYDNDNVIHNTYYEEWQKKVRDEFETDKQKNIDYMVRLIATRHMEKLYG